MLARKTMYASFAMQWESEFIGLPLSWYIGGASINHRTNATRAGYVRWHLSVRSAVPDSVSGEFADSRPSFFRWQCSVLVGSPQRPWRMRIRSRLLPPYPKQLSRSTTMPFCRHTVRLLAYGPFYIPRQVRRCCCWGIRKRLRVRAIGPFFNWTAATGCGFGFPCLASVVHSNCATVGLRIDASTSGEAVVRVGDPDAAGDPLCQARVSLETVELSSPTIDGRASLSIDVVADAGPVALRLERIAWKTETETVPICFDPARVPGHSIRPRVRQTCDPLWWPH